MSLQLQPPANEFWVQQCVSTAHGFVLTIGSRVYTESVIITPTGVTAWHATPTTLSETDCTRVAEQLAHDAVEVILLGVGAQLWFPPPAITRPLIASGIGLEIMDTAAACRTYNLLLSDARPVVAALLV